MGQLHSHASITEKQLQALEQKDLHIENKIDLPQHEVQQPMRVLVRGARHCGKSQLCRRLCGLNFISEYVPTLEIVSNTATLTIEQQRFPVELWEGEADRATADACIQELAAATIPQIGDLTYDGMVTHTTNELRVTSNSAMIDVNRGAHAAICVFDPCEPETLEYACSLVEKTPQKVDVMIVAIKKDEQSQWQISSKQIQDRLRTVRAEYTEVSNFNNFGIDNVWRFLCKPFAKMRIDFLQKQILAYERTLEKCAKFDFLLDGPDYDEFVGHKKLATNTEHVKQVTTNTVSNIPSIIYDATSIPQINKESNASVGADGIFPQASIAKLDSFFGVENSIRKKAVNSSMKNEHSLGNVCCSNPGLRAVKSSVDVGSDKDTETYDDLILSCDLSPHIPNDETTSNQSMSQPNLKSSKLIVTLPSLLSSQAFAHSTTAMSIQEHVSVGSISSTFVNHGKNDDKHMLSPDGLHESPKCDTVNSSGIDVNILDEFLRGLGSKSCSMIDNSNNQLKVGKSELPHKQSMCNIRQHRTKRSSSESSTYEPSSSETASDFENDSIESYKAPIRTQGGLLLQHAQPKSLTSSRNFRSSQSRKLHRKPF